MKLYVTILFAAIIFASPALADYHYVSHQGSNEYPYTSWETAADSIKFAVDAADPGDTVYIGAGEWKERVVTAEEDSNLAVIGAGMDSTYWWWDELGHYTFWCGNNMLVEDIHFAHTRTGSLNSGNFNNFRVDHCYFDQHGKVMAWGSPHAVVYNCIFDIDNCNAVEATAGAGKVEVRNCLVEFQNDGYWVFDINSADSAIIENTIVVNPIEFLFMRANESLVRNNLVYYDQTPDAGGCDGCPVLLNNTFDNFHRSLTNPGAAVDIWELGPFNYRNNSFSRMTTAIQFMYSEPWWWVPVKYSNLWDVDSLGMMAEQGVHWDTVGILWQDPMFEGEFDYHLQNYSPLIDAGDPDILDIDGSRSDIGVFGGPAGRSYDYLDLPPLVPDSLSAIVIEDTIFMNWRYNYEADFNRYQLHRETYSGFEPSINNLIAEPDTSYYVDTDLTPGHNYYYRIAAVDNQDNLSDYSEELEVITTGVDGGWGAEMPTITTIESNYPNPFNSQTTIVYTVANLGPLPARINIDIYDIMGRKVRSLVNARKEGGEHRIIWDGRNDSGSECPSGVYFAKISQWGVDYLDRHEKLVLLR